MKNTDTKRIVSIARQPLTDDIRISNQDMVDLIELVEGNHIGTAVEADIIWADTLPLKHFSVSITLDENYVESVRWRFDIIDTQIIHSARGNDCHIFGVMTLSIKKTKNAKGGDIELVAPMACSSEQMLAPIDVWSASEGGIHGDFKESDPRWMSTFRDLLIRGMHIFYSIEVALLNPVVETVFVESANTVPLETTKPVGKNKRARIKYIKRHAIRMSAVNAALEKRGFVRHCNIWYVTGHWREYSKTGKKIFIKGYWKGALRSLKEAETRDREIITA